MGSPPGRASRHRGFAFVECDPQPGRFPGAGTDTYSYLGSSEAVLRIANSRGTTTDAALDAAGTRLGSRPGQLSTGSCPTSTAAWRRRCRPRHGPSTPSATTATG